MRDCTDTFSDDHFMIFSCYMHLDVGFSLSQCSRNYCVYKQLVGKGSLFLCFLTARVFSGVSCAFERCLEVKTACNLPLKGYLRMCLCWTAMTWTKCTLTQKEKMVHSSLNSDQVKNTCPTNQQSYTWLFCCYLGMQVWLKYQISREMVYLFPY